MFIDDSNLKWKQFLFKCHWEGTYKWATILNNFNPHAHSDGSNLRLRDSITKVEKLVQTVIMKGHKGVALTDHESVSLHIQILQYVQQLKKDKNKLIELESKYDGAELEKQIKLNKIKDVKIVRRMQNDFKLVLGNEIYLVDSMEEVKDDYVSGVTKFPHYILLAKDEQGHKQLRELSSLAWIKSFYTGTMERTPTLKEDLERIVKNNPGHLIASTACAGGEFLSRVSLLLESELNEKDENIIKDIKLDIHKFVAFNRKLFKDDFYIEIQPTVDEWLWKVNKRAVEIAEAYKLKTIISTDTHYHTREMRLVHESFLKSKEEERELSDFYATTYTMNTIELWSYFDNHFSFKWFYKSLANTVKILDKIDQYTLKHDVIIPELHLDKAPIRHLFIDWYDKAPYIKKFAYSDHIQDLWFLHLVEKGFVEHNQEFNEENIMRINIEMEELWEISITLKQRMSSYYNLVEYIVDLMWDDKRGNSFVGVARGSVTGFYTCFLMNVTQMNPIKWNLPHWRHLSKERPELPDVDLDSEAAKRQNIFKACKHDFGFDNVLNIATFKTEGSKSSVLTACRGLGINNDVAQSIADMIPFERGAAWSLEDCFYGNEKENREPIKEFINSVQEVHPQLKETMLAISGLIVGRSIHASGVYIFKNGYLEQNALMKAPNGNYITQWHMKHSDWAGGLKVDFLTIEAEDKIRSCMEFLLDAEIIEWKGTWRKTYNAYIHPEVIQYDDIEMWKKIAKNEIDSLFQFVTPIGLQTARELEPTTLTQLADANSLMRLVKTEDAAYSPSETYQMYKNDISLWYKEVEEWGLDSEDIDILKPHLLSIFGVASTQEDIMEMSMNPKIANFDIVLANKLRKCIAKKDKKAQEEMKEIFFAEGRKCGTSEKLLSYVWYVQIIRQLGYSFSRNHTSPYSNIALQEMNLAHYYDPIFWNCACLSVDSGSVEEFSNYDEPEGKNKTTNYGKMASAIGKMRQRNVNVGLPHINEAKFKFYPNYADDEIVFGLKAIVDISDDVAHDIIEHRPYKSLEDFHNRMVLTKKEVELSTGKKQNRSIVSSSKVFTLIKAGAFDKLENKPREEIMSDYMRLIYPSRKSFNVRGIEQVSSYGIIPQSLNMGLRVYNFRKFITNKSRYYSKYIVEGKETKNRSWYILKGASDEQTEYINNFLDEHFMADLKEDEDYYYNDEGYVILVVGGSSKFEKLYGYKIAELKKWLNTSDCLDRYNQIMRQQQWNKHAKGNISKWEMDSLSFYYHEHELKDVDVKMYDICKFDEMRDVNTYTQEEKDSFPFSIYKETKYPQYPLSRIVGTVLDKNKDKHSITLLTPNGVILVKYYAGQFGHYNKQISEVDDDGTKTVIENGWFKRGTKLMITGFRRGDQFKPKRYKGTPYQHTTCLIETIRDNGSLQLKTDRTRI